MALTIPLDFALVGPASLGPDAIAPVVQVSAGLPWYVDTVSWTAAQHPECLGANEDGAIETVIVPKPKDIGAFEVRRCLPAPTRRAVGPFVFFDEMGPATLPPGVGMDVRPHPHINLATITYLFDGEIHHRDSLGTSQVIKPGAVNLMVAGRGIAHSERSPASARPEAAPLHGLQLWMALPEADEETAPAFHHYPETALPAWTEDGAVVRLLMGSWNGRTSPVRTFSPTVYLTADLASGVELSMPDAAERGLYVVQGTVDAGGRAHEAGSMIVLLPGAVRVRAKTQARIGLIGGDPLGERHLWWNFVSSRPERIEQAKADWAAERFAHVPGDEQERIPLPKD